MLLKQFPSLDVAQPSPLERQVAVEKAVLQPSRGPNEAIPLDVGVLKAGNK